MQMTKAEEINKAIEAGDMEYDYPTVEQATAALQNNAPYQARKRAITEGLRELIAQGLVTVVEGGFLFTDAKTREAFMQFMEPTDNGAVN